MRSTRRTAFLWAVAVLGVASAWTIAIRGQARGAAPAPPPQRVVVTVTEVKPEMVTAYQDLIKTTLIPAVKKGNLASYVQTWANGASGQGFTFVQVRPIANYAELDIPNRLQQPIGGAEALASYNAKIRPMIVSQHTYIETVRPDLTIQSNSTAPPALAVVQIFQIAPGKGNDFTASMTSDYLPNYKKAGVKDFWVYAANFGGAGGQIVTVRPIAKYAELDEPGLLNKAGLSADAIAQIGARRAATASVTDNELHRFVPELSFGSAQRIAP